MGKYGIGVRVRDEDGDEGVIIDKRKGERLVKYDASWLSDIWWPKDRLAVIEGDPVSGDTLAPGTKVRIVRPHRNAFGTVLDYPKLKVGTVVTLGDTIDVINADEEGWTAYKTVETKFWVRSDDVEVVDEPTSTLALEAGKFYRTRDGSRVGPAAVQTPGSEGDFYVGGWNYDADGTCSHLGGDNPLDIVAEWIDEPVAAEPAITIEVGKFYRTRDGRKAGPMRAGSFGGFRGSVEADSMGGTRSFESDGTHRYCETDLDLVEEWVEPKPYEKFKVGDRIRHKDLGYVGHVESIVSAREARVFWDSPQDWSATDPIDELELAEPAHPIGTTVTITGTVSGLNGDKRSVVVGTGHAKFSFDVPVSALKAA